MGIVRVRELVMERLREMVEVIETQYELTDDERAEAQRLRDELIEHLNN